MAQSFANIYRGGVATTSEIPLLYLTESNRGFFGMMLQPPFKISRSAYAITPWIFEYFLDGQSARPIVFSMMPGSYCRRRSRNINSLSYLLLSTRIDPVRHSMLQPIQLAVLSRNFRTHPSTHLIGRTEEDGRGL